MKKLKRHEEHENHERWLVSYADFITLMFAFFVVMYATSTQNVEKEKEFEESVREKLKIVLVPGGQGGPAASAAAQSATAVDKAMPDPFEGLERRRTSTRDLEDSVQRLISRSMTQDERQKMIADIRSDAMGVRIALAASAFFDSGSTKLRYSALKSLDKIGEILKRSPHRLMVEGHTDDQPFAASRGNLVSSNWELASLRATSVVRYLIKYHQMDPHRLAAISYADQKPLVPNTSGENRAKNRRIEVLIVNAEEE